VETLLADIPVRVVGPVAIACIPCGEGQGRAVESAGERCIGPAFLRMPSPQPVFPPVSTPTSGFGK